MPLFVQQFDAQIRFVLKSETKARLMREATRRGMSASDLLRLYIEDGLARGFVKTGGRRPAPSKLGSRGSKLTKAP
jgi:hypothetical protein